MVGWFCRCCCNCEEPAFRIASLQVACLLLDGRRWLVRGVRAVSQLLGVMAAAPAAQLMHRDDCCMDVSTAVASLPRKPADESHEGVGKPVQCPAQDDTTKEGLQDIHTYTQGLQWVLFVPCSITSHHVAASSSSQGPWCTCVQGGHHQLIHSCYLMLYWAAAAQ